MIAKFAKLNSVQCCVVCTLKGKLFEAGDMFSIVHHFAVCVTWEKFPGVYFLVDMLIIKTRKSEKFSFNRKLNIAQHQKIGG